MGLILFQVQAMYWVEVMKWQIVNMYLQVPFRLRNYQNSDMLERALKLLILKISDVYRVILL
jgi:hypothetical protein